MEEDMQIADAEKHDTPNNEVTVEYSKSCEEVLGTTGDAAGNTTVLQHSVTDGVCKDTGVVEDGEDTFQSSIPNDNSPEAHLSPCSLTSCDMERTSPMGGSPCMDCSDDGGGISEDDGAHGQGGRGVAAGITSTWVSSGGECYGSLDYSDYVAYNLAHYGLGYHAEHHNNSPSAFPHHSSSAATEGADVGVTAPASSSDYAEMMALAGTGQQSKNQSDLEDDVDLGADNGLFGVTPSCDVDDFVDVGGAGRAGDTEGKTDKVTKNNTNHSKSIPSTEVTNQSSVTTEEAGPVYGPALPWQPFSAALESSTTTESGDIKSAGAGVAGECGLQNLGNTCFMAAGLQCLLHTPPFVQYFFVQPHDHEPTSLLGSFSELAYKVWSGRYASVRPVTFRHAFGSIWRDFRDYRQHDCQEFVTLLLEGLRKQMSLKSISNMSTKHNFELGYCKSADAVPVGSSSFGVLEALEGEGTDRPDTLFGSAWTTAVDECSSEDSKESAASSAGHLSASTSGAAVSNTYTAVRAGCSTTTPRQASVPHSEQGNFLNSHQPLSRTTTSSTPDVDLPPNMTNPSDCCMEVDVDGTVGTAIDDLSQLLVLPPSVSSSSLPSSPPSPRAVLKQQDDQSRGSAEGQEDGCGDSGATSPKSSVSSSSVDSHLVNVRLQPIPEEVLLHAASSSLQVHSDRQADLSSTAHCNYRQHSQRPHRASCCSSSSSTSSRNSNRESSSSRIADLDESFGKLDEDEDTRMLDDPADEGMIYDCVAEGFVKSFGSRGSPVNLGLAEAVGATFTDSGCRSRDADSTYHRTLLHSQGERHDNNFYGDDVDMSEDGNGNSADVNTSVFVSSSSDSKKCCANNSSTKVLKRGDATAQARPMPDILQNTITASSDITLDVLSKTSSSSSCPRSNNSSRSCNDDIISCGTDGTYIISSASTAPCDVSSTIDDATSTRNNGVKLLDIMKETKTSNVNVLVQKNQQNNEILFDSEKYAKCDKVKLKDSLDNLSRAGTGKKRVKEVNLLKFKNVSSIYESRSRLGSDVPSGGSKEIADTFINDTRGRNENITSDGRRKDEGGEEEEDNEDEQMKNKRIRLDEKNIHHQRCQQQLLQDGSAAKSCEEDECVSNIARVACKSGAGIGSPQATGISGSQNRADFKMSAVDNRSRAEKDAERDIVLAQESWRAFMGSDGEEAVLMNTFYGQFKSCLVCNVCGHSSVKFDPFGTLSVPLPHANETQIVLTYVSADSGPALKCLVTLCKISDVRDLKVALVQLLTLDFQRQRQQQADAAACAKSAEDHVVKERAGDEDEDKACRKNTNVKSGEDSYNRDNTENICKDKPDNSSEKAMETDLDNENKHVEREPKWDPCREPCASGFKNTNVTDEDKSSSAGATGGALRGKKRRSYLRRLPDVSHVVVAEVLDNHVAKILEDSYLSKYVNQTNRLVYAFHLPPTPLPAGASITPSSPPTKPTAAAPPGPDVVPTQDKMGSRNRSNLTLYEGTSRIENNAPDSSTASAANEPLSTVDAGSAAPACGGVEAAVPDPRCCLKGGSKIYSSASARFGDYAAASGNGSAHGGIDGGNASCSYPSTSDVATPFIMDELSAITNTGGGVIGGAAGTTSVHSGLGLPSTSGDPLVPPGPPNINIAAPTSPSPRLSQYSGRADVTRDIPGPVGTTADSSTADQSEWKTCNICLEEMCQTELKSHGLCYDCLLCESCLDMSCKHHGGDTLPCPVCQTTLTRASLIPVAKRQTQKPKPRLLRVCVVFRLDADSCDNNKRHTALLGHPRLVSVPSRLPLSALHSALQHCIPPGTAYTLLLVEGRGYNCSRCLFMSHCRGCEVTNVSKMQTASSSAAGRSSGDGGGGCEEGSGDRGKDVLVNLQAGDTICVRFTHLTALQRNFLTRTVEHSSLALRRQDKPLTLYDCLRAFTRSETLDSSESWFCPECACKQSATKTVSVWRCPPYLIIHLERFLFHGTSCSKVHDKVIFPLENLDMGDYLGGQQLEGIPYLYNLYGVVCHMGVAQAGHYTALVRSPRGHAWRYFNDESVMARRPCEDEYSSGYLLFYHRNSVPFQLLLPKSLSFGPTEDCGESIKVRAAIPLLHKGASPGIDVTGDKVMDCCDNTSSAASSINSSDNGIKSSSSKCRANDEQVQRRQQGSTVCPNVNNSINSSVVSSLDAASSAGVVPDPMEGSVLSDWSEVPMESSSLSRTAPSATRAVADSSPSKSTSDNKGLPGVCNTSQLSRPQRDGGMEESAASSSSLELFAISSSDTSLESGSAPENSSSASQSVNNEASSSCRSPAHHSYDGASVTSSSSSSSSSSRLSAVPVTTKMTSKQEQVDGAAGSSSNISSSGVLDEGCGVSSSSSSSASGNGVQQQRGCDTSSASTMTKY